MFEVEGVQVFNGWKMLEKGEMVNFLFKWMLDLFLIKSR